MLKLNYYLEEPIGKNYPVWVSNPGPLVCLTSDLATGAS